MTAQPRLGFVGAGKVGTTLARLLYARGYTITCVFSRNPIHAFELANVVEAAVVGSFSEMVKSADLIFLTVSDDAVQKISLNFVDERLHGKAFVHTSGVHEASILQMLTEQGAMIGSLHPAYPFATVDDAMKGLLGSTFAVQSESDVLRGWLSDVVQALDGKLLLIASGQKALYHSALVFASNFGVTLYAIAQRLLASFGAQPDASAHALNVLMAGMVGNITSRGIPDALTGPLVRGDAGTIEAHIAALEAVDPALSELYMKLAEQTLPLVVARGVGIEAVETILRRAMDDAHKHT